VLGLPAFAISLAYTIVTAYAPVLLGALSGPTVTGALIGCEGLLALVIPPLVGGWSDRHTSRIGNRLPFILVGAALVFVSLVLMPVGDGSLLWVSTWLIAFFVAYLLYYAPYYALYPDLVPRSVRGRSQGIQGALRSAGLLLAMGTGGLMLAAQQELPALGGVGVLRGRTALKTTMPPRGVTAMPDEQELFTIDYPARDVDAVWNALKRALATMDLRDADDANQTARFTTGVSLTSWGENMIARVDEAATGARVTVRGRAKGSSLTTKWGEDVHATGVEKDLRASIDDALVQTSP